MLNDLMELYPVGTVVRLKGATKNIMIFGVCQTNKGDEKTYDYIGVLWPEGNIGTEGQFLFQHTDIEEILFKGYDNAERKEFLNRLKTFYESTG